MSLKERLNGFGEKCRDLDGNIFGNLTFAASTFSYQLYEDFISNPTYAAVGATVGVLFAVTMTSLIYLLQPIAKKIYEPQIKTK